MEVKVQFNKDGTAIFTCPACEYATAKDVSAYKKINQVIKIKCTCKCGHFYKALLERRRHHRKETSLSGSFTGDDGKQGYITVKDVSMSGIGFTLLAKQTFKIGDKLSVEFTLDDDQRSRINREVIVRNFKGDTVGAEFASMEAYDRLGGYLLS